MAGRSKTIKGVHKSEDRSGNRFTLTFDPSWGEPPRRAFRGSYELIPTPKGSQAKPRVGCFRDGNLVFSAGARNGCYETLLSLVDQKITTKCEMRESMIEEGHYLLIELDPDFKVDPKNTYILDTETTGVDKDSDEVLSLAIVDLNGNELFHDFVRPKRKRSWQEAQSVNHISPAIVRSAQHLDERLEEIAYLLDESALIVGYNIDFDLAMLRNSGLPIVNHCVYDVMKAFSNKYTSGTWTKLQDAASCFGYSFTPHNALDDAKATAHIFRNMEKLTDNPIPFVQKAQGAPQGTNAIIQQAQGRTIGAKGSNPASQRTNGKDATNSKYVAIAVVVAFLLLGAFLTFVFNSGLFWGVLIVGILLLWIVGKLAS